MARTGNRQQLRINRQTPATRCEICHQSDNYDPVNGNCSRCNPSLELSDVVLIDEDDPLGSLANSYAQATQQPTAEENNSSLSQSPNTISQQVNSVAVLDTHSRRGQILDDTERILDRRQERIGIRESALNQRQTALDERERIVNQRQTAIDEREEMLDQREQELNNRIDNRPVSISSILKPRQHWNLRLIATIIVVVVSILLMFVGGSNRSNSSASAIKTSQIEPIPIPDNNTNEPSEVQTQAQTQAQTNADEEIPYKLELDSNPEKVTENPVVVLAVGNVTILELEEAAKDVLVGDKETVEVVKSSSSPKKFYLIGKAPISNSNIVIESASKTTAIFFQVIENTGVGGFNGQVKVKTSGEKKS